MVVFVLRALPIAIVRQRDQFIVLEAAVFVELGDFAAGDGEDRHLVFGVQIDAEVPVVFAEFQPWSVGVVDDVGVGPLGVRAGTERRVARVVAAERPDGIGVVAVGEAQWRC